MSEWGLHGGWLPAEVNPWHPFCCQVRMLWFRTGILHFSTPLKPRTPPLSPPNGGRHWGKNNLLEIAMRKKKLTINNNSNSINKKRYNKINYSHRKTLNNSQYQMDPSTMFLEQKESLLPRRDSLSPHPSNDERWYRITCVLAMSPPGYCKTKLVLAGTRTHGKVVSYKIWSPV